MTERSSPRTTSFSPSTRFSTSSLEPTWGSAVDRAFLERVEALDSHRLKVVFKATDADGNPQVPGLSVWQFGLGFMPILPEHYWGSVVEDAKGAGEGAQQIETLFAMFPKESLPPMASFSTSGSKEPSSKTMQTHYFRMGATVTQFEMAP